ncbi:MAG: hypothetical protein WHT07_12465 [Desulfobaccales bacterium]
MKNKIKEFYIWLKVGGQLWPFQIVLILLILLNLPFVPFVISFIFCDIKLEEIVKSYGLILQISGMLTVIKDINARKKIFNLPHAWDEIKAWWKSCPFYPKNKTVSIAINGIMVISGFGDATISEATPTEATIEERISRLEKNFNLIIDYLNKIKQKIDEEIKKIDEKISEQIFEIKNDIVKMGEKLTQVNVENIKIQRNGVLWLLSGKVFVTFPQKIAEFLPKIF